MAEDLFFGGRYCSDLAASRTRVCVARGIDAPTELLKTSEAVETDTPAAAATSDRVVFPVFIVHLRYL